MDPKRQEGQMKRRSKEECNEIFWRMSADKKSGKLDRLTTSDCARMYNVSCRVASRWLDRIDNDLDRFGNPILTSNDGSKFVSLGGRRADRVTVYAVPSDWQTIKISTKRNIETGESIKDIYDQCSPELKIILWKLLSFEIMESLDPDDFYYPQHHFPYEKTGQSIAIKIAPVAFEIWSQIPKTGTTSKSNWAMDTVIKPFFLHIGLI